MITPVTPLATEFSVIVRGLCAVIGHHAYPLRTTRAGTLLVFVHYLLFRTVWRLDHLIQRWQAGTLPKPRPTRPPSSNPQNDQTPEPRPRTRLPTSRAWLIRLAQPTAQFGLLVENYLRTPDIVALVAAAPQAGRLLRPLCRMLAIDIPEHLRLPPRPPHAKPTASLPSPRLRGSRRGLPHQPTRPLPAYVRAAARAWRKYDR